MRERIAAGRLRLEELLNEERWTPLPILLMGLLPALLLAAILFLTGIVRIPLNLGSQDVNQSQTLAQLAHQGRNQAALTVQEQALLLGSAIDALQDSTLRISPQLENARGKLEVERSVLISLQSELDATKREMASSQPAQPESTQPGNLLVKKGSLDLRYRTWQQAQVEFLGAMDQLKSTLAQAKSQSENVRQAAAALSEAIRQNPADGTTSPAPGDELPLLEQYRSVADAIAASLPALEATEAEYQRIAASAMAETQALVPPTPQPIAIGGVFADLANQIPDDVGQPVEKEYQDPGNGDVVQHTTGGMLVLRKSDNMAAFTDGTYTWILGPQGLQKRENGLRFAWETGGQ